MDIYPSRETTQNIKAEWGKTRKILHSVARPHGVPAKASQPCQPRQTEHFPFPTEQSDCLRCMRLPMHVPPPTTHRSDRAPGMLTGYDSTMHGAVWPLERGVGTTVLCSKEGKKASTSLSMFRSLPRFGGDGKGEIAPSLGGYGVYGGAFHAGCGMLLSGLTRALTRGVIWHCRRRSYAHTAGTVLVTCTSNFLSSATKLHRPRRATAPQTPQRTAILPPVTVLAL